MGYPIHYKRQSGTDETCKQCSNYYAGVKRCDMHKISPHAQATCNDNTMTAWKCSDEYKIILAAEKSAAKVDSIESDNLCINTSLSSLIERYDWLVGKHSESIAEESPDKRIVQGFKSESVDVMTIIDTHSANVGYLQGWQDFLMELKSLDPIKLLIARGMLKAVDRAAIDITIMERLHIDPAKSAAVLAAVAGMEVKTEQMEVKIKTEFGQMDLFGLAA